MTGASQQVVRRAREVLRALGDALVQARLDDVLATELELAEASDALGRLERLPEDHRTVAAGELLHLRDELARCRRLGRALRELAQARSRGQDGDEYDRGGQPRRGDARGALAARV